MTSKKNTLGEEVEGPRSRRHGYLLRLGRVQLLNGVRDQGAAAARRRLDRRAAQQVVMAVPDFRANLAHRVGHDSSGKELEERVNVTRADLGMGVRVAGPEGCVHRIDGRDDDPHGCARERKSEKKIITRPGDNNNVVSRPTGRHGVRCDNRVIARIV